MTVRSNGPAARPGGTLPGDRTWSQRSDDRRLLSLAETRTGFEWNSDPHVFTRVGRRVLTSFWRPTREQNSWPDRCADSDQPDDSGQPALHSAGWIPRDVLRGRALGQRSGRSRW